MRSRPTATSAQGSEVPIRPRLSGRLGVIGIVFMVVAAAAPLTVIAGNVPIAIAEGPGAGAPVGFVIGALVLLLFSIGFVTMTPFVKETGAFFSYITAGLGHRLGLGAAFVALVVYTAIQIGTYGYMGWALGDLVGRWGGPSAPWWLWALAVLAVVAFLGYRHIELSAKVLGVALVLEIAVVAILDVAIFGSGGAEGITGDSFTPAAVSSGPLGIAVLFALTGFIGFEATAVFRDEARDPEKTIPRATYLAVVLIGVFYTISCWAIVEAWGPSNVAEAASTALANGDSMLLETAATYVGTVIRDIMQVLWVSSLFACVLSFHTVISRYQYALSHKKILPSALGRVHDRHQSPYVSSLVQSGTALVFVAVFALARLDPVVGVFGFMAAVSTVGMVMLMLMTSVAVPVYFYRRPLARQGRFLTTYLAPMLAVAGLSASLVLIIQNFPLVTGKSTAVSSIMAMVPVAALLIGCCLPQSRFLRPSDDGGAVGPSAAPRG